MKKDILKFAKLHKVSNTKREIFINLEKEVFVGNVLDIGGDNYGIIYSLYKCYNDEIAVEYIGSKSESVNIEEGIYDSCILLFSFNDIWFKYNKKSFIKEISKYLREKGTIYIWDIDKGYGKSFNSKIRIMLPDRQLKEINKKDLNIFKDNSKENTVKILEEYFEVIDLKSSDNIYYIKAEKKGRLKDENCNDRDKL